MRVAEASFSPYKLASKADKSVGVVGTAATGQIHLGLAEQFCYFYFETFTILLHLFNGLGLVIADLNYCQA